MICNSFDYYDGELAVTNVKGLGMSGPVNFRGEMDSVSVRLNFTERVCNLTLQYDVISQKINQLTHQGCLQRQKTGIPPSK